MKLVSVVSLIFVVGIHASLFSIVLTCRRHVAVNIDSEKLEIRSFFFYVFRLGYTAANVARCICSVRGEGAVSEKTAQKWFKRFKEGNVSLDDEPSSQSPFVIENEKLNEYMRSNSRSRC